MTCRHCRRCSASRPRGLCWGCYYTPGIREQYSRAGKYYPPAADIEATTPEPTDAAPGTAEKIEVLARRFEAKQHLFHPDDAKRSSP